MCLILGSELYSEFYRQMYCWYSNKSTLFCSIDDANAEWVQKLERLLLARPSLGTRCMDSNVYTIELVYPV